MSFRAGEALWIPSQLAATSNETDKEIRALVVEIKEKPPVTQGAKAKSKAKAGTKTAASRPRRLAAKSQRTKGLKTAGFFSGCHLQSHEAG